MIILKAVASVIVAFVAIFSVVFMIASGCALNAPDHDERKDAFATAFWSLVTFSLCAAAITMLSGCQAAKTIIDTCRDSLCR